MLISEILAPAEAPQVWTPPSPQILGAPSLDDSDLQIIDALRDAGPVKTWSLLNYLTEGGGARSRADGRQARRSLWDRVRRLKRLGFISGRARNQIAIAATKLASQPKSRPRRQSRTPRISSLVHLKTVSAPESPNTVPPTDIIHPPENELAKGIPSDANLPVDFKQTQSAAAAEEIRRAAQLLARTPRREHRTGLLHGQRVRRGLAIRLRDGRAAFVWAVRGGRVIWSMDPSLLLMDLEHPGIEWGIVSARAVTLVKNPAAMALAALKRGHREVFSARKAAAARRNGARACRPGRLRGRPRRTSISLPAHQSG